MNPEHRHLLVERLQAIGQAAADLASVLAMILVAPADPSVTQTADPSHEKGELPQPGSEHLMNVSDAAALAGVSVRTLRRAYLARQLRVHHVGYRVRFRLTDVLEWIEAGGKTKFDFRENLATRQAPRTFASNSDEKQTRIER